MGAEWGFPCPQRTQALSSPGKTFIGLKITELLLRNQGAEPWGEQPPLLVVCYTNHALDQFMEGAGPSPGPSPRRPLVPGVG